MVLAFRRHLEWAAIKDGLDDGGMSQIERVIIYQATAPNDPVPSRGCLGVSSDLGLLTPKDPPPLPWVTVTLTTNSTLEVSVRTLADTCFTSPVLDDVQITRTAEAPYIEPTPLGNPTSALGTGGDTEYPGTADNFYLQTRRDSRRNGDIIGPATGVAGTPNPLFTSLAARPELQGAYFYEIEVPIAVAGLYDLELRVSCLAGSNNAGPLGWSVYGPDATNTDFTDNVAAGAIASGTRARSQNTCTDTIPGGFNTSNRGQIDNPNTAVVEQHIQFIDTAQCMPLQSLGTAGKYVLRVRANSGEVMYSIRAARSGFAGSAQHCTSLPMINEAGTTDPATPNCPSITAIDWLGSAAVEEALVNGTDPFNWRTIDNEVWGYSHAEYNTFTNNGTGDLPDTNSVPCGPSGGTALTDPRVVKIGGIGQVFQDRTVRFFLEVGTPACNGTDWVGPSRRRPGSTHSLVPPAAQ